MEQKHAVSKKFYSMLAWFKFVLEKLLRVEILSSTIITTLD